MAGLGGTGRRGGTTTDANRSREASSGAALANLRGNWPEGRSWAAERVWETSSTAGGLSFGSELLAAGICVSTSQAISVKANIHMTAGRSCGRVQTMVVRGSGALISLPPTLPASGRRIRLSSRDANLSICSSAMLSTITPRSRRMLALSVQTGLAHCQVGQAPVPAVALARQEPTRPGPSNRQDQQRRQHRAQTDEHAAPLRSALEVPNASIHPQYGAPEGA